MDSWNFVDLDTDKRDYRALSYIRWKPCILNIKITLHWLKVACLLRIQKWHCYWVRKQNEMFLEKNLNMKCQSFIELTNNKPCWQLHDHTKIKKF